MLVKMISDNLIKMSNVKFNTDKIKSGDIVKHTLYNYPDDKDDKGFSRYAIVDFVSDNKVTLIMWRDYSYLENHRVNIHNYKTELGFVAIEISLEDIIKGYHSIEKVG